MKLHAKNGELRINDEVFLPHQEDFFTEYLLNQEDISVEIHHQKDQKVAEVSLEPGLYKKVTATVEVVRYYPVTEDDFVGEVNNPY